MKDIWQGIVRKLHDREATCFADFAERRDILKIFVGKRKIQKGLPDLSAIRDKKKSSVFLNMGKNSGCE